MKLLYSNKRGISFRCFLVVFLLIFVAVNQSIAQPVLTNTDAENALLGNYNPSLYTPSVKISDKDSIVNGLMTDLSVDTLKEYLLMLESFGTRNTGSDTNSASTGIGSARRWIKKKFKEYSKNNENRLLVGYLDFSANMCGISKHRNVMAVLPGLDTSKKGVLVVEAHMDSRCESSCDTSCFAPGMDDNGSGTVLVMELARVMSKYSFDRTIVFTTVTGEEQGLKGGEAMASYLQFKKIDLLACLNNDVVGGVECGVNSSPPSCSPAGSIDSTNLRVFSFSPNNDTNFVSVHKQLARYIKLQQIEEINTVAKYRTSIKLQIREDRVGRGGDHIPFRQRAMRAIRFTSSHEHGDGAGKSPDRQHTVTDVLGYDLSVPPDGILDTFLIDFNYLKRNTLTNAVNLAMLAKSPPIPNPVYATYEFNNIKSISFEGIDTLYSHRIGVRKNNSASLYFDTVLTFHKQFIHVSEIEPKGDVQLHVMNLEGEIESLPTTQISDEYLVIDLEIEEIKCLEFYPNPTKDFVSIEWKCALEAESIRLQIWDNRGVILKEFEIQSEKLKGNYTLDVSDLKTGQYNLITIINEDEVFSESIIKY